ncbi:hypothetical protein [Streptomyces fagopyri]|uniref:hypothetical protein n=1 Tax=Streptomyces fagopyri TaxID=2662397 RepID=UPI00381C1369
MGASTAVVCLSAVLAACGSGAGSGRVAAGAPGGSGRAVAPTGDVSLSPLDGENTSRPGKTSHGGTGAAGDGTRPTAGSAGAPDPSPGRTDAGAATRGGAGKDGPQSPSGGRDGSGRGGSGHAGAGSGGTPGTPAPSAPSTPAPAAVEAGSPEREATDRRWCEKVTLSFRNTGGTAVRSGTVTLGTHIIGALGIDWATIASARDLPAPIAPGAGAEKSWTVCVDAWRVPLGMHIETRDVSVQWK